MSKEWIKSFDFLAYELYTYDIDYISVRDDPFLYMEGQLTSLSRGHNLWLRYTLRERILKIIK